MLAGYWDLAMTCVLFAATHRADAGRLFTNRPRLPRSTGCGSVKTIGDRNPRVGLKTHASLPAGNRSQLSPFLGTPWLPSLLSSSSHQRPRRELRLRAPAVREGTRARLSRPAPAARA